MASLVASSASGGDGVIYVRTTTEDVGYHWFRLNTEEDEEMMFIRHNIPPPNPQFGSSMAAVGSTIYALGGLDTIGYISARAPIYPDVYYYYPPDTSGGGGGWKQAPPMTRDRVEPYLVPLHDGRLLVIGGIHGSDVVFPFAEIYDPDTQTWTPCKTMPERGTVPTYFDGHAIFGNKVFLYAFGLKKLCYYDIQQDLWDVYNTKLRPSLNSSALIDGILYFFEYDFLIDDNSVLLGFDFEDFKSLPSSSSSQPPLITQMTVDILPNTATTEWLPRMDDDFSYPLVYSLALGSDKLALVWNPKFADIDRESLVVYVSVFQMIKMNTRNGDNPKNVVAVAQPLYQRRYQLEGIYLFDCVAVNCCKMKQLDEEKRVRKKKPRKKKRILSY